jgi:hypothetical protein
MRPAIIPALILFGVTAHAQSSSPRREDPLQRKLQSVVQLELLEASMTRRPAAARERELALAQIKEDFERIQLANDDLNSALAGPAPANSRRIAKLASEIRKRAKRLQENLALPPAPKNSRSEPDDPDAEWRAQAGRLSKLIESFVGNPLLSQKHVIDAGLAAQAAQDLAEIITLSGVIRKIAG